MAMGHLKWNTSVGAVVAVALLLVPCAQAGLEAFSDPFDIDVDDGYPYAAGLVNPQDGPGGPGSPELEAAMERFVRQPSGRKEPPPDLRVPGDTPDSVQDDNPERAGPHHHPSGLWGAEVEESTEAADPFAGGGYYYDAYRFAFVSTWADGAATYSAFEEEMGAHFDNEYDRAIARVSLAKTPVRERAYVLGREETIEEDEEEEDIYDPFGEVSGPRTLRHPKEISYRLSSLLKDGFFLQKSPEREIVIFTYPRGTPDLTDTAHDCLMDPVGVLGLVPNTMTEAILKGVGLRVGKAVVTRCMWTADLLAFSTYAGLADGSVLPAQRWCGYTVGVVGGVGPLAGAHFLDILEKDLAPLKLPPTAKDLCVDLYSNPIYPTGPGVALTMPLASANYGVGLYYFLHTEDVDVFCSPGNTFHQNMYKRFTKSWSSNRQINIIEEVAKFITAKPDLTSVGLLGTKVIMRGSDTPNSGSLYSEYFDKYNRQRVARDPKEGTCSLHRPPTDHCQDGVWLAKAGRFDEARAIFLEESAAMRDRYGIQAVIGGCTEVVLALGQADLAAIGIPHFYDSSEVLVGSVHELVAAWARAKGFRSDLDAFTADLKLDSDRGDRDADPVVPEV